MGDPRTSGGVPRPERVYHIVQATGEGLLVILALVLIFALIMGGLMTFAVYSSRRTRFAIGEGGLDRANPVRQADTPRLHPREGGQVGQPERRGGSEADDQDERRQPARVQGRVVQARRRTEGPRLPGGLQPRPLPAHDRGPRRADQRGDPPAFIRDIRRARGGSSPRPSLGA